jgi:predicted metal-dependent enzyme (double-stranded beta helix superfamily)
MSLASQRQQQRQQAVNSTLHDIRTILAQDALSRHQLDQVKQRLAQLAANTQLFPEQDFPPPDEHEESSTRYRLNADEGDQELALYLNALLPGKSTLPHNHTTWAAIAAIEGEEINRLYQRQDDASQTSHADLQLLQEVVVAPGHPIAFLPDDIHSIHVTGNQATRHLHLYGRPLETLVDRIAIDPITGEISNYNATQMKPSQPQR